MNITPETCFELSKIDNIVGIKEASGNISQVAKIASLCGDDFAIYSGNDDQVYDLLELGGKGVISVNANIIPKETHDSSLISDGRKFFNSKRKLGGLAHLLFCFKVFVLLTY